MKLTVHIGLHKTGTTSIQHALRSNREVLMRDGVLYPKAGEIDAGGHLNLVWESIGAWKYNGALGGINELIEEVRSTRPEHVLISAESFSGYYRRPEVLAVVERIGKEIGASPKIVSTVRPQFSLLDSLYAQNASTGYTAADFVTYALDTLTSDSLDFESLLGRWFDQFGEVAVIPVERGINTPLVDRFLEAADITKPVGLVDVKPTNLRASVRTVEFGRKACELLGRMSIDAATKHGVISRMRHQILKDYPDDPPFSGLTPALARFISRQFSTSNANFVKKRLAGRSIFSVPLREYKIRESRVDIDTLALAERDYFEWVLLKALGIGSSSKK